MTPEDVLSVLMQTATPKSRTTLQAIYDICNEQRKRGVYEFSATIISRLGKDRGVPKAQSIRNRSGVNYRALLQAFTDTSPQKKLKRPSNSELEWIDEIKDPKQRLFTEIMLSELKEAKLKITELIPPNQRVDIYDYGASQPSEHRLSDLEIKALKHLLSNEFRLKWNLQETEFGELVDSNGAVVFRMATIDALKKALEHLA